MVLDSARIPDDELIAARLQLDELASGEPEVRDELLGLLADSLHRATDGLVAAIGAGEPVRAAGHAHTLRGAASMAGLMTIAGLAGRIEHAEVPPDALPREAVHLQALARQAIAALRGSA